MVSTMKIVDTNSGGSDGPFRVRVNRTGRRTFSREYKLEIVQECSAPGVSVAGVALSHRINANLVRRWIVQHRQGRLFAMPTMLPVTLATQPPATPAEANAQSSEGIIEIDLNGACVRVRGSVDPGALRVVLEALKR